MKNWSFAEPPSNSALCPDHPYDQSQVTDAGRIPAQGNNSSPAGFENHFIVYDISTGRFYDPSYGGPWYASSGAHEDAAFDGFRKFCNFQYDEDTGALTSYDNGTKKNEDGKEVNYFGL